MKMGITGVARVYFTDCIRREQEKTVKALEDAQYYRNLKT